MLVNAVLAVDDVARRRNHVEFGPLVVNDPQHEFAALVQPVLIGIDFHSIPVFLLVLGKQGVLRFIELVEFAEQINLRHIGQPLPVGGDVLGVGETEVSGAVVHAHVEGAVIGIAVAVGVHQLRGLLDGLDAGGLTS